MWYGTQTWSLRTKAHWLKTVCRMHQSALCKLSRDPKCIIVLKKFKTKKQNKKGCSVCLLIWNPIQTKHPRESLDQHSCCHTVASCVFPSLFLFCHTLLSNFRWILVAYIRTSENPRSVCDIFPVERLQHSCCARPRPFNSSWEIWKAGMSGWNYDFKRHLGDGFQVKARCNFSLVKQTSQAKAARS